MPFTTAGYPGTVSDNQYAQMAAFFSIHGADDLSVDAVSGVDRTVRVTFSRAYAPGVVVFQSAPDDVQLPANGSSNTRRDRIILRHDWNANGGDGETTLTFVQGTPSPSPQLPSITVDPGNLYEQHLCEVRIGPGQGESTSNDIGLVSFHPAVVVRIGDNSAMPFPQFGALVLDETTGLARFSNGSSYQNLRVQQSDTDVAVLRKYGGSGQGNAFTNTETFYNSNNTLTVSSAPPGTAWGIGGPLHSAQWRHPLPGVYQITASLNIGAVDVVSQTSAIEFRLRRGMSAGNAESGTIPSRAPYRWNAGALAQFQVIHILDTYEVSSTSSIYGLTLSVEPGSGNMRRGDNGSHFSVIRIADL